MKKRIGLIILILVFILFCFFPAVWSGWKGAYLDASKHPLQGLENASDGLKEVLFFFPRLIRTYRDNFYLASELENLKKSLVELQELKLENDRLKQLLSFKENAPYQTLPASVIGRDYSGFESAILIGSGSLQGLKKNMVVISPSGVVGILIEVNRSTSRVLLLTDSDCRVTAMVQRTRDEGVTEGYFGRLRMKYLDPQTEIKSGDTVITSGYGGVYPKGLVIGQVTMVGTEPGSMYKYAMVQPAVNFFRLEEVLCIK
ncbi:MAG: rod shape-determining protein MreC [Candidatus Omnitrophica bacterium]|nr:rod shape-determining protein MreC [Candidatus Omnitrophota bacterium]